MAYTEGLSYGQFVVDSKTVMLSSEISRLSGKRRTDYLKK